MVVSTICSGTLLILAIFSGTFSVAVSGISFRQGSPSPLASVPVFSNMTDYEIVCDEVSNLLKIHHRARHLVLSLPQI